MDELEIEGTTLEPSFSNDIYNYTVDYEGQENSLQINAKASYGNVSIIGNENLVDGQNIITIMVSDKSEEGTSIYQIYVNKNVVKQSELNLHIEETQKEQKIKQWIIIGLGVVIGVCIIILIILLIKRRRFRNEQFKRKYYKNKKKLNSSLNMQNDDKEEDIQDYIQDNENEVMENHKENENFENQVDDICEKSNINQILDYSDIEKNNKDKRRKKSGKHSK